MVATRTNALRQRTYTLVPVDRYCCRNPRECAVAKHKTAKLSLSAACRNPRECAVAKLSGFYRHPCALRRNPRECAVAKSYHAFACVHRPSRNPRECAVAKGQPVLPDQRIRVATRTNALWQSYVQHDDGSVVLVATRTNALWQSRAIVVPEPETPKA